MSLTTKIFGAFFMMAAIAVITGITGWMTVERIDTTMNKIIDYEMVLGNDFNELESTLQTITVAQRTLLNTNLATAARLEQYANIQREEAHLKELTEKINALLDRGASQVSGWNKILDQWETCRAGLEKWNAAIDEGVRMLHEWESTTILNPDVLLRDTMRYRGDHFQLATRLGEMIAEGKSIGPEISPSDNLCAFGKWRERFDNNEEVFSRNPNLRQAMDIMTGPHRDFHRTAAEVQKLVMRDSEGNQEAITKKYKEHLTAAQEVVGTFAMISDEAEKARELYASAEDYTMSDFRRIQLDVLDKLAAMINANKSNMDANFAASAVEGRAGVSRMQILSGFVVALGCAIMAALYMTIRRQLTGPLTRVIATLAANADEVASEAREVAASSTSLSDGATTQAASLEQTSAAIEEITSMARKNLENAKSANQSMQSNARQIRESTESVGRMSIAMNEIKNSSEKIGGILKTIEEIAFQTNLLALNAAVEAARAGEAGKGFAVVADEVRNLAQRSAQAVKDTSTLIAGTVECVKAGAGIPAEIEEHFNRISGTTAGIVQMIDEIDGATGEQTQGMEQINQSVSQIDRVNQENARHAEVNATASVNLNEGSRNLMLIIDDLSGVLVNIIGCGSVSRIHETEGDNVKTPPKMATGKPMRALPPPRKE